MWRRVHPMTLYANGLRARHHISAKNTFRTRLSSWWLISKGDQPTHPGLVSGLSIRRLLLPGRPIDSVQQSKVCILASLFTDLSPEDIRGACLLLSAFRCLHLPASLGSTGITPLALLRRLCHLPGAVLRALRAAMNAAPSPDRDP